MACAETPAPARGKPRASTASQGDPFSPELRARVDALKKEIETVPTTADNVYARVDVLWDWANAFALKGGDLPINLPVDVAIIRWGQADGVAPDAPMVKDVDLSSVNDYIPYIDHYIRELALKEDRPDALGKVTLASSEPLLVDSWVTMQETYTVGSAPIAIGGGVVAGRQWLSDVNDFQNVDPKKDNYLTRDHLAPRRATGALDDGPHRAARRPSRRQADSRVQGRRRGAPAGRHHHRHLRRQVGRLARREDAVLRHRPPAAAALRRSRRRQPDDAALAGAPGARRRDRRPARAGAFGGRGR